MAWSRPRLALLALMASLAVGCGGAIKTTPGPDPGSSTDASVVPWSDGKSAIAISCMSAGACKERARALCPGGYGTLKGDEKGLSITVRCS